MFPTLKFDKTWTINEGVDYFPTIETSEDKVREDMQYLFDAIKNFLNDTLIPSLEAGNGAANTGAVDRDGKVTTVQAFLNALDAVKHSHDNKALLDAYTHTEEELSGAIQNSHRHENKDVLDHIESVSSTLGNSVNVVPSEAAVNAALTGITQGQVPVASIGADRLKTLSEGAPGQVLARDESSGGFNWVNAPEVGLIMRAGRLYQDGQDVTETVLTVVGAAPAYQISTQDIVAGETPLPDGTLYFVYE